MSIPGLRAWHGCMEHNHNHCPECRTCDCHNPEREDPDTITITVSWHRTDTFRHDVQVDRHDWENANSERRTEMLAEATGEIPSEDVERGHITSTGNWIDGWTAIRTENAR